MQLWILLMGQEKVLEDRKTSVTFAWGIQLMVIVNTRGRYIKQKTIALLIPIIKVRVLKFFYIALNSPLPLIGQKMRAKPNDWSNTQYFSFLSQIHPIVLRF